MSPSFRRASPSLGSCCKASRYSRMALVKSFLAANSSAFLTWAAGEVFPHAHTTVRTPTLSTRTNFSMPDELQERVPLETSRVLRTTCVKRLEIYEFADSCDAARDAGDPPGQLSFTQISELSSAQRRLRPEPH